VARRKQDDDIEREALRLYDLYNPRSHVVINVSKQDCINEARRKLADAKAGR